MFARLISGVHSLLLRRSIPPIRIVESSHHSHRSLSTRSHTHTHTHSNVAKPNVLVVGGSGALGRAMVERFNQAGWKTICMDYFPNENSSSNITLLRESTWKANLTLAEESLKEMFQLEQQKPTSNQNQSSASSTPSKPLSVVIHCAGSWLGGNVTDSGFLSSVDPMMDINLKSAIGSAYLAGKFLTQSGAGLMVLTGAAAAGSASTITPTASMISYGMSKAATHQLALSLAQPDGGLNNATVVCMLPTMIDTPTNREMANATQDCVNWTPPSDFADLILSFGEQLSSSVGLQPNSPKSSKPVIQHTHVQLKHGGFYHFQTEKGKTTIKLLP